MKRLLLLGSVWLLGAGAASAQWGAAWLQNEAYWGDGKAEFNIYDAEQVRYGQARPSEVLHILVREPFSDRELVKAEAGSKAGTFPVIKLNQILHIPTGLYVYQQMHSAFWRADSGRLIKATLTSNDSCGNTYKEFRALGGLRGLIRSGWNYEWRTYWEGVSAGETKIAAPDNALFYDELPVRVRTLDFAGGALEGQFAVALAPTIIRSKKDEVVFQPAQISWSRVAVGEPITVEVKAGDQQDRFVLGGTAPYLLREWKMADGGSLKLRQSLKVDYWNYNKVGDKERAISSSK